MSSAEQDRWQQLAGRLHDEVLLPVAEDMAQSGASYLAGWRSAGAESYFAPPLVAKMAPADFEFPGGGRVDRLIAELAGYWSARGDLLLVPAAERMKAIAAELETEGTGSHDGSVDIFCYTMF
jgi:hypothetical protein